MKSKFMLLAVLGLAGNVAFAQGQLPGDTTCPVDAQVAMDAQFGAGTSAVTSCLKKRDNIRVVLNMSTAVTNPKSGLAQTLVNVNNMIGNYEGIYGLTLGENGYQIVVIAHFAGGRWLLTDDAYNRTYGVTTGNPSRHTVEALLAKGIPMIMCQNTMRGNNWVTSDLIPGVQEVPGGVTALADYSAGGWAVLTP